MAGLAVLLLISTIYFVEAFPTVATDNESIQTLDVDLDEEDEHVIRAICYQLHNLLRETDSAILALNIMNLPNSVRDQRLSKELQRILEDEINNVFDIIPTMRRRHSGKFLEKLLDAIASLFKWKTESARQLAYSVEESNDSTTESTDSTTETTESTDSTTESTDSTTESTDCTSPTDSTTSSAH